MLGNRKITPHLLTGGCLRLSGPFPYLGPGDPARSPAFRRSRARGPWSEKGFLSHREQNSVSGYQPRRMSWHIPPRGAELFCVLSRPEAAGGRESSVQRSLSGVGGLEARPGSWPCQLCPLLPQGKAGRPAFLSAVVPTTQQPERVQWAARGPADWAKGSS